MSTSDTDDTVRERPIDRDESGDSEEASEPKKAAWWPPPGGRRFWPILFGLLALNWLLAGLFTDSPVRESVAYNTFIEEISAGNVVDVTSRGDTIQGTFANPLTNSETDEILVVEFMTERPTYADDDLLGLLTANDVVINADPVDVPTPWWLSFLMGFGPILLLVGLYWWFLRSRGGPGGIGGLGKSKAHRYQKGENTTTFDDVAGIDEAENELIEIVDYLRNPARYLAIGARIPSGVLLTGAPGTGKTLLARAVAGEADVPFFSVSASEFIEMIVGVGASRVRDLFDTAKEAAPSIIFIDELDAIGRARGGAMSFGGADEREQTLNQILTEMDGFTGTEGVIVLSATNRPEVLDPALLRPGRFDRHVVVNAPDAAGRIAILDVHTRGVALAEDVNLQTIASTTPGMVGADLRNLVNEAALLAARRERDTVHNDDFADALERIVLGAERHILITPGERHRTAIHEAGHALLGMLLEGADPVRKVSIIPRGRALGVTFQSPDTDRHGYTDQDLHTRIAGALGGRAAESLNFNTLSTGAESDFEIATAMARHMVGRWGMSELIGPVSVLANPEIQQPGFGSSWDDPAESTRTLVDAEVRRIISEDYQAAVAMLDAHHDQLDALAQALLENETLDEADAYRAAGLPCPSADEPEQEDLLVLPIAIATRGTM